MNKYKIPKIDKGGINRKLIQKLAAELMRESFENKPIGREVLLLFEDLNNLINTKITLNDMISDEATPFPYISFGSFRFYLVWEGSFNSPKHVELDENVIDTTDYLES